jgi:hypothetical protein
MARRQSTQYNNNSTAPAGYLRLSVKDSEGNLHRLPRDLPLYESQLTPSGMVEKAKADPEYQFEIVGTVFIPDENAEAPKF